MLGIFPSGVRRALREPRLHRRTVTCRGSGARKTQLPHRGMQRHRESQGLCQRLSGKRVYQDQDLERRDRHRVLFRAQKRLRHCCRYLWRTEVWRQLPGGAHVKRRAGDAPLPHFRAPHRAKHVRLGLPRRPARDGIQQLLAQPHLRNHDRQGLQREECTGRDGDDCRGIFRHQVHEGNQSPHARQHADSRCRI